MLSHSSYALMIQYSTFALRIRRMSERAHGGITWLFRLAQRPLPPSAFQQPTRAHHLAIGLVGLPRLRSHATSLCLRLEHLLLSSTPVFFFSRLDARAGPGITWLDHISGMRAPSMTGSTAYGASRDTGTSTGLRHPHWTRRTEVFKTEAMLFSGVSFQLTLSSLHRC
jgi:hypothetical protein